MVDSGIYPPTAEQQAAIDLFADGRPRTFAIQAGAGTGKTTTLTMVARATQRPGTYLAFNRMIADDAGRVMPPQVQARTVHSIAARGVRQHPNHSGLLDRLGAPRMAPYKMARHLGLGMLAVTVPQVTGAPKSKVIQPAYQASHILRAVAVFCQSDDAQPDASHFPYIDGIDPPNDGRRTYVNNRQVARELEPYLQKAWADLTTPTGQLRFTHDVYLKLAQLENLTIPGDYLLFDEAQDASPVMLKWLDQQGKPVVYVGDSQQQIYEWRGAIDAMARLPKSVPTTFLTQSWRFGQPVADVANLLLDRLDAELRLTGTPSKATTVALGGRAPQANAVLCRTNGMAVNMVLQAQQRGLTAHLVGGAQEIVRFARACGQLQAGERTTHPELACFNDWHEVQAYVADDPGAADLKTLVGMIERYGVQIVVDALDGCVGEAGADVVVSTAHKAKGREWPVVRLAADFEPGEGKTLSPPELRLLYVAATRATDCLDISGCVPLLDMYLDHQ